jgi:transcriptional regulator with XRE-family HTH domain
MAQADAERGDRIRSLRENLHLTQEAMADRVGLTLRGYQEWEAGGGIKWDNAKRLAKVAGVEPDWIMGGDRGETPDVLGVGNDEAQLAVEMASMRVEIAALRIQLATLQRTLEPSSGTGSAPNRTRRAM